MRRRLVLVALVSVLAAACTSEGNRAQSVRIPIDASPASPSPAPIEIPSSRPEHPAGSGELGLKWNWAQPDTFPFVRDTSGGWTFYEVEWCDIEPRPGHLDWIRLDEVVRDARLLGHEPMLKLRTGRCWGTTPASGAARDTTEAASKEPSTPPVHMQTYLTFVRSVVHRYSARGVHQYAIENEPDVANFWAASISDYRRLASRVAPVIRAADPRARVLDAGTSSTGYGVVLAHARLRHGHPNAALRTYQRYYARRLKAGMSRWPAVDDLRELRAVLRTGPARRAVHAVNVSIRLMNAHTVDVYQLHYYEPTSELPKVLGYLDQRLHHDAPVEAWEIGVAWPGGSFASKSQADETFRLVGRLLAGGVRRIVYLPVAFTPDGQKQVFRGLIEVDGTPLPAGNGWIALVAALSGVDGGTLAPVVGDLAGAAWTAGGRDAAIVWARHGSVPLDPGDVDRLVDATGAEVDGPPVVGRRPVLVLGSVGGDLTHRLGHGRH